MRRDRGDRTRPVAAWRRAGAPVTDDAGRLPFGRVLVAGEPRHALLDGEMMCLLDRPAYAPGRASDRRASRSPPCACWRRSCPTRSSPSGLNYRAHAAELAMERQGRADPLHEAADGGDRAGRRDRAARPRSQQVDYEAELALVVGRRCRDLTPADGGRRRRRLHLRQRRHRPRPAEARRAVDARQELRHVLPAGSLGRAATRRSRAARVSASLDGVEVQHGLVGDMIVTPLDLLVFVSGDHDARARRRHHDRHAAGRRTAVRRVRR